MTDKNYLGLFAKSFNWAGFFYQNILIKIAQNYTHFAEFWMI